MTNKILTEKQALKSVEWLTRKPKNKPKALHKRRLKTINVRLPQPGSATWIKQIKKAFKHPSFKFTPSPKLHIPVNRLLYDKTEAIRLINAKQTLIKLSGEK